MCASRDDRAHAACSKFSQNAAGRLRQPVLRLFRPGMGLPLCRPIRRFGSRNVNKRSIPILSVNQFQASATNESGVFAGVGRERHRWGASCIAHADWQPLPPASCVLRLRLNGDGASIRLSKVFVDLWRHTGSFEVAFPQLAPPGPAFASVMRLLA